MGEKKKIEKRKAGGEKEEKVLVQQQKKQNEMHPRQPNRAQKGEREPSKFQLKIQRFGFRSFKTSIVTVSFRRSEF